VFLLCGMQLDSFLPFEPLFIVHVQNFPEPKEHPGLLAIGDYLFDSTINGVLDSADIATDLALRFLGIRRREVGVSRSINAKERGPYLLPDPTVGDLHAATMANTGRHCNKNS